MRDSPPPETTLFRPGDLTSSGALYEANYADWVPRVDSILRVAGLGIFWSGGWGYDDPSAGYKKDRAGNCYWARLTLEHWSHEPLEKAIEVILSHVSPSLRRRVVEFRGQDFEEEDPFETLQRIAQPFERLWDLPPEVRLMIYEHALEPPTKPFEIGYDSRIHTSYQPVDHPAWPAVLQVCRQMRHEILPAFYSKNEFSFQSVENADGCYIGIKGAGFGPWIQEVVCHNVKYLRKVTYSCSLEFEGPYQVDLEWSKAKGFSFLFSPPDLEDKDPHAKAESMKENDNIIQKLSEVEQTSKLMGVEGESLVLAMMTVLRILGHDKIDALKFHQPRRLG